jgi:hypothetical protein
MNSTLIILSKIEWTMLRLVKSCCKKRSKKWFKNPPQSFPENLPDRRLDSIFEARDRVLSISDLTDPGVASISDRDEKTASIPLLHFHRASKRRTICIATLKRSYPRYPTRTALQNL